jgi:hypothetical protein
MKVGGQPMIFTVDTGAEHSLVIKSVGTLTECRATRVGATSTQTAPQFC